MHGGGACFEPGMLVARVIRHEVQDDEHACNAHAQVLLQDRIFLLLQQQTSLVHGFNQLVCVVKTSEQRVDVCVIADVIAEVRHWRLVNRTEPHRIDAQGFQVIQFRNDSYLVV